jgi:hypothetical protein
VGRRTLDRVGHGRAAGRADDAASTRSPRTGPVAAPAPASASSPTAPMRPSTSVGCCCRRPDDGRHCRDERL